MTNTLSVHSPERFHAISYFNLVMLLWDLPSPQKFRFQSEVEKRNTYRFGKMGKIPHRERERFHTEKHIKENRPQKSHGQWADEDEKYTEPLWERKLLTPKNRLVTFCLKRNISRTNRPCAAEHRKAIEIGGALNLDRHYNAFLFWIYHSQKTTHKKLLTENVATQVFCG